MKILEIGCGNASAWVSRIDRLPESASLVLSDISPGMIRQAKSNLRNVKKNLEFKVIDADSISFCDAVFDLVIANSMLYHVRDIAKTLKEIRRVLKPEGRLVCTTIGLGSMKELIAWIRKFRIDSFLSGGALARNFGIENGEKLLRRHFRNVRRILYRDHLEVPAIGPVIEYLSSTGSLKNDGKMNALKTHLENILKKRGVIRISKQGGMFMATV
jgi:ubiquinone/menaquinone biosynthesis C-methylase UbiE